MYVYHIGITLYPAIAGTSLSCCLIPENIIAHPRSPYQAGPAVKLDLLRGALDEEFSLRVRCSAHNPSCSKSIIFLSDIEFRTHFKSEPGEV